MDKKIQTTDIEFDLLISQRDQLSKDLTITDSTFQKTILALFAGFITLIASSTLEIINNEMFVLLMIQIIMLLAIFIGLLLTSGNMQRYCISAIDQYIKEKYGINRLFYQGEFGASITIGKNSIFPYLTFASLVISILLFFLDCDKTRFNSTYLC